MLFRELLTDELFKQREEFTRFAQSQAGDLDYYVRKIAGFSEKSYAEIFGILHDCADCGAMPSEEMNLVNDFSLNFRERWQNHEEARQWAFEILKKRTTFAADGSQIVLEREISFRVGGVQIGWFENPQTRRKATRKTPNLRSSRRRISEPTPTPAGLIPTSANGVSRRKSKRLKNFYIKNVIGRRITSRFRLLFTTARYCFP